MNKLEMTTPPQKNEKNEKSEIIPDLTNFFSNLEKYLKTGKKVGPRSLAFMHYHYDEKGQDEFLKKLLTNPEKSKNIYDKIITKNEFKNKQRKKIKINPKSGAIGRLKMAIEYVFYKTKSPQKPPLIKPGGSLCEIGGPSLTFSEDNQATLNDIVFSGTNSYTNINPSTELSNQDKYTYNSFTGNPRENHADTIENTAPKLVKKNKKFDIITSYNVYCPTAKSGQPYGIYANNHKKRVKILKTIGSIMKINGLLIIGNNFDKGDIIFTPQDLIETGFNFIKTKDNELKSFFHCDYVFQYKGTVKK